MSEYKVLESSKQDMRKCLCIFWCRKEKQYRKCDKEWGFQGSKTPSCCSQHPNHFENEKFILGSNKVDATGLIREAALYAGIAGRAFLDTRVFKLGQHLAMLVQEGQYRAKGVEFARSLCSFLSDIAASVGDMKTLLQSVHPTLQVPAAFRALVLEHKAASSPQAMLTFGRSAIGEAPSSSGTASGAGSSASFQVPPALQTQQSAPTSGAQRAVLAPILMNSGRAAVAAAPATSQSVGKKSTVLDLSLEPPSRPPAARPAVQKVQDAGNMTRIQDSSVPMSRPVEPVNFSTSANTLTWVPGIGISVAPTFGYTRQQAAFPAPCAAPQALMERSAQQLPPSNPQLLSSFSEALFVRASNIPERPLELPASQSNAEPQGWGQRQESEREEILPPVVTLGGFSSSHGSNDDLLGLMLSRVASFDLGASPAPSCIFSDGASPDELSPELVAELASLMDAPDGMEEDCGTGAARRMGGMYGIGGARDMGALDVGAQGVGGYDVLGVGLLPGHGPPALAALDFSQLGVGVLMDDDTEMRDPEMADME